MFLKRLLKISFCFNCGSLRAITSYQKQFSPRLISLLADDANEQLQLRGFKFIRFEILTN